MPKIKKCFYKISSIIFIATILLTCLQFGCGSHLDDPSDPLDKKSIKAETNKLISNGECGLAFDVAKVLSESQYADTESIILAASALACQGRLNFIDFFFDFSKAKGSSIFAKLATIFPAASHNYNYMIASSEYLYKTSSVSGSRLAAVRPTDVNFYMTYLQMGILGVVLNRNGQPDSNGTKTIDLIFNPPLPYPPIGTATMSQSDACQVAVSFGTIVDSLSYTSITQGSISDALKSIKDVCNSVPGNLIPDCQNLPTKADQCDASAVAGSAAYNNALIASLIVQKVNTSW